MKLVASALLTSTLVAVAASTAMAAAWTNRAAVEDVLEIGATAVWAVTGWFASRVRPDSRIGPLMQVTGLVLALNLPDLLALDAGDPVQSALILFGRLFAEVQFPVVGHVLLSYPTGRLPDRGSRGLIGIAYAYAAVITPVTIVMPLLTGEVCPSGCASGPARPDGGAAIATVDRAVWILLGAAAVALLVRRAIHASGRERRMLAYPLAAILTSIGVFVLYMALDLPWATAGLAGQIVLAAMPVAGVAAVPVTFLVGLLRDRFGYQAGATLLGSIERAAPDDLENALRTALGDPDLLLAFPTSDGGHVDQRGQRLAPESITGRPSLPVGDGGGGRPVAVIVHDPSLREQPQLLATLRTAVRLAVDNARLLALNRAHLEELRASRRRLVAAADDERRRLERNLHDGAQQRLVSLGLAVQMLATHLPDADPAAAELLMEIDGELHAAIDELRNLASGIHPAVLTDHGLGAAVQVLAGRCRLPVTVHGRLPHRPPPAVEAAAYFALSEALANTLKHAPAASVTVHLSHQDGILTVIISDDGTGGADPAVGTGLRGLHDRVAAADGRLRIASPPGCGTRIELELPCESSLSTTAS